MRLGTSRAAKAPPTRRWNDVIGTLKAPNRNAETVASVALSVAMSTLPEISPVSTPIVFGALEGIRFVLDVQEKGLEAAVQREAILISERYVIPSISEGLWYIVSSKMDQRFTNSPFGRLAQLAFTKTMDQVMSKGARALIAEET
jgi:hypothetical protein